MISKSIDITRDQSLIMRGMAIVAIALHNYCHLMYFTINENESSFSKEPVLDFFSQMTVPSNEWIYNFFSFLGWYGVPVFIFLTGFGLVRKYERHNAPTINKTVFLYSNWLKLFALLLPGVLYYVGYDVVHYILTGDLGYLINIYNRLFLLTFLNDIFGPWTGITPGVYWYFGLTLEFYLLYAFIIYRRSIGLLLWITLASVVLQFAAYKGVFGDPEQMLWWIRQNITGWMVPFAFGIVYARIKTVYVIWVYVIIFAAAILFFPTMIDPVLWQISLLCAIVLVIVTAKISYKIPYWRGIWFYIGRLSPFIFAAHPIVRSLFFSYFSPSVCPKHLLLISYFISVVVCAIIYRRLWNYLTPILKKSIERIIPILKHK